MSETTTETLRARIASVPFWFHSIELAPGVVTPGAKTEQELARQLELLDLPEIAGKSVLDIGAWDGFFSFEAERRGASRVVALDHFVWSLQLEPGGVPSPNDPGAWQPSTLPGKRGFDLAREALRSEVEELVTDFMTADPGDIGTFDVVFYLGVLYHIKDPLGALTRLAQVTREVAVIETQAIVVPGFDHLALCEFYETSGLKNDPTNWWAPNLSALESLCRAAGFARVETKSGPRLSLRYTPWRAHRTRIVVHAHKAPPERG